MNSKTKSVCIFYPTLENLGGIERVIEAHACIFAQRGIHVTIVTEQPVVKLRGGLTEYADFFVMSAVKPSYDFTILDSYIKEKKVDAFILHGAHYESAAIIAEHLKNCKLKVILNIHFSFPSPLYLTGDEDQLDKHLHVARQCDAVATVSAIDAVFWNALGVYAIHVQNPINVKTKSKQLCSRSQPARRNLLWIGRMMEPKQPEEAMFILQEIVKYIPNVKLTMVGGTIASGKALMQKAKALGIFNNVCISPETSNIQSYYEAADMHLLTSSTESFCLVLAEAKARGIPTAMYEIPFLDLVGDGKGIIAAPYNNREELAKKIVDVLTNEEAWIQLCQEASSSLKSFNDDMVYESWIPAFDSDTSSSITPQNRSVNMICVEFYKAWTYRVQKDLWKINIWNDFEKLVGNRAASMMSRLLRTFFRNLRKTKQYLSR